MQEEQGKLKIRVHLYDEDIEVTINREHEEYCRAAAKQITDLYNRYAQKFKGQHKDHHISLMVLLDIATQYQVERAYNNTAPYDNVLARLTTEIEEALGSSR